MSVEYDALFGAYIALSVNLQVAVHALLRGYAMRMDGKPDF